MSISLPFALVAVAVFALSSFSTHGETWFQEAKRIRREADAPEPRSKSFEILPDFQFTDHSIKAGATFKNAGERVIVKQARIHVELPIGAASGKTVYKSRDREVHYNGEPAWTGRSRATWAVGSFTYTVTAIYKGNVYEKQFRVGRTGLLPPR